MLLARGHEVRGLDAGYYEECTLLPGPEGMEQLRKDLREVEAADLDGVEGVIHLAALSNDPLGELDPSLTDSINLRGTERLAGLARRASVRRFVYVSSQSMYGISDASGPALDEELSEKRPLTAYARTKWDAELALRALGTDSFVVVSFRPSTVFGASPRLRCDIVFNNLVACGYTTGRIEIASDGTPWRPVVHVRDLSDALIAGVEAPAELVAGMAFNVGLPDGNFTVRQLAEAAQRAVPGSALVFTGEHGRDSRTYRVSFRRILTVLGRHYRPSWTLDRGADELVGFFRATGFSETDFRGPRTVRLAQLRRLLDAGRLDRDLRWVT